MPETEVEHAYVPVALNQHLPLHTMLLGLMLCTSDLLPLPVGVTCQHFR